MWVTRRASRVRTRPSRRAIGSKPPVCRPSTACAGLPSLPAALRVPAHAHARVVADPGRCGTARSRDTTSTTGRRSSPARSPSTPSGQRPTQASRSARSTRSTPPARRAPARTPVAGPNLYAVVVTVERPEQLLGLPPSAGGHVYYRRSTECDTTWSRFVRQMDSTWAKSAGGDDSRVIGVTDSATSYDQTVAPWSASGYATTGPHWEGGSTLDLDLGRSPPGTRSPSPSTTVSP